MPTRRPPLRHGVPASFLHLPERSPHRLLIDHLAERFPAIARADWAQRMAAGAVLAEHGTPLPADAPFAGRTRIWYYRCPVDEPTIACAETVLFQDAYLVVADKPHFLPVTPGGRYARETLLARLQMRLNLPDLAPLHRLDRETAGLVLFAVQPATRNAYTALFRQHAMHKVYEAIAWRNPALEGSFVLQRSSRLAEHPTDFFRMAEVLGQTANSHTVVEHVQDLPKQRVRLRLTPHTGQRHQLRVHLCNLGMPIVGDRLYPQTLHPAHAPDDDQHPLQLLAQRLAFVDPITGQLRVFVSQRVLADGAA